MLFKNHDVKIKLQKNSIISLVCEIRVININYYY